MNLERDYDAFELALKTTAAAFGVEMSPARVTAYLEALAGYDVAAIQEACKAAVRSSEFFPTVAALVKLIEGSADDRAALAWTRVYRAALKGLGTYRPLDFQDPILHATVTAMGGWRQLLWIGDLDTENVDVVTTRKQFMQLYGIYERRGAPPDTPPYLTRLPEHAERIPLLVGESGEPVRPPLAERVHNVLTEIAGSTDRTKALQVIRENAALADPVLAPEEIKALAEAARASASAAPIVEALADRMKLPAPGPAYRKLDEAPTPEEERERARRQDVARGQLAQVEASLKARQDAAQAPETAPGA